MFALLIVLAACATRSDVHRVEDAIITLNETQRYLLHASTEPEARDSGDQEVLIQLVDQIRVEMERVGLRTQRIEALLEDLASGGGRTADPRRDP